MIIVCIVPGVISLQPGASLDHEAVPVYHLTVCVTDAQGLSAEGMVIVNVTDVNEPPIFTPFPGMCAVLNLLYIHKASH